MGKSVLYNGEIRDLSRIRLYKTLAKDPEQMEDFVPEPSGTLTITANGTGINVKEYATVDVAVEEQSDPVTPEISVNESGLITVSGQGLNAATHQLSSADDADFVAGNILKGVSIFGLAGTAEGPSGFTAIPIEVKTSTTEYTLDGTTITPDASYGSFAFPLKGDGLYWFNYISGLPAGLSSVVSRFLVAKYVKTNYIAYKTRKNTPNEFNAVSGATVTAGGNYLYFIGSNTVPFYTVTYQGFYLPLTNFDGQSEV